MKHPRITASLEHIYGFVVRLKFTNTGDREASLYRYNACVAGNIDNNVFIIKNGDTTIAYSGRYVKRRAPAPDDFDALPPRSSRSVDVDLPRAYKLAAGIAYAVVYEAYHDDPTDSKHFWLVTSSSCVVKA